MLKKLIIPTALAVLILGTPAPTVAQTADYQTYFTFSGPVTLPGATLPAGKYLFRLADPVDEPQGHQRVDRRRQEVRGDAFVHPQSSQQGPERP